MFQKQTFGASTSAFGTTTTPSFGSFKPTTGTNAFGAPPAFGSTATAQPTTGGGLFGSNNTSGGLFGAGAASTSAPAFGSSSGGFGFSANTSAGGLFSNNQSTGLFGNAQNTSAFGAKPAGFGFGNTSATGTTGTGLFGSTPSTSTGLFGQQNTTLGGGGLFTNTGGAFGQQQAPTGTGHTKYNPVVGTDVVVKSGNSQNVNIKHHCITCMKEYESKSLEELRLEDYTAGRKGSSSAGMFTGFQQQPTENKPLFGGSTFGQPATTSATLFGGGSLGTSGFGQTNTFAFGGNAQNQTTSTGLFGNKPAFGATSTAGTGIFGTVTTQAPAFGTTTSTFGGFGSNTQNQQNTGLLFGAKPATTGFGATPASTGFGSFGTGLFNAKPQQTTAPTFGSTAPSAFGSLGTGFGTNTSTSGFFGSLGKPNTTPMLGGQAQNTGFGTGLGAGLGTSFQAKPAAPAFGNIGTGSIFQQPQANNTFRTGLDSGLGNSMFGNTPSLGGGMSLGGFNANTTQNQIGGSASGGGVHEQILTLAARPYGDSPLFKDLLPDSANSAEEALKPTNPAALKAALDSAYKVASPTSGRLRVVPRPTVPSDKKSLFDGLEESDATLEDKLSMKPSRKRLVLRPSASHDTQDSVDRTATSHRSLEEQTSNVNVERQEPPAQNPVVSSPAIAQPLVHSANDVNNSDTSEKQGNWLSGNKVSWIEKEKPVDGDTTPRIYPNLDKEMSQTADRRASWLTTKPLRKPLASNPEAADSSVRELAVRQHRTMDKENVDSGSVSEEENVIEGDSPPHPAGIKLRRPGYYTIPSLEELADYIRPDGSCVVPHFTIGRKNYGNVHYDCEMDVANLDLDALVHFLNKEVIIYPEDADKPPVGQGLNRRAVVTLDRVWPRDKTQRRLIVEPDRLLKMDYEGKLRRVCDKHETKFIEYRPESGSWVFRVEHFSKYGLTDSDEEDDPVPDVLKRQLATQALQKSAAPAPPKQPATAQPAVPVGLGGLGGLGGLSAPPGTSSIAEDLFSMQRTSLNLTNGVEKAFEMDTTEDSADGQSMFPDSMALGVKSPTSELARLEHRHSHSVQLMKASLYADIADVDEDMSQSSEDQLVPLGGLGLRGEPSEVLTERQSRLEEPLMPKPSTEEVVMRPLVVRPHTVVLKYHRKVPPFSKTIAGRLQAACIADVSVCRARHSRVGFGPRGSLAFVTTTDAVSDLPRSAELWDLGRYLRGRDGEDWSEPMVTSLAIGREPSDTQDVLPKQMESLLEFSQIVEEEGGCPRLVLSSEPEQRHKLLMKLLRYAESEAGNTYRLQIWKLCEALWGADLENDGVAGMDVQSRVHRHRQLLRWLQDAVADITQRELKKLVKADPLDESDGHSGRVWTLLLGGRVLEACKVARDNGDLHMATLLAQAAGDPVFRSLVEKQLNLWRECGAHDLVAGPRMAALQLIAGIRPRGELEQLDWIRALHATARYLCPQVPHLEQVVRTYESYFSTQESSTEDGEELDLSTVQQDEMGMKLPLPPYNDQYDWTNGDSNRRVLDLRYELLRARAFNSRPKLQPAGYTLDPMDYSLSFLLGCWLGSPATESIIGVAEQLEARDCWHQAIQALAYLQDNTVRGHLIRGVLSRNAPSAWNANSPQLNLLRRLGVPSRWLLLAQGHRAKYEHKPMLEVEHLVGAEQWNAAHRVLMDELFADAVLADNIQSIRPLLEKMNDAAERHEISGWECGGKALYNYMYVCEEVRGLVAEAEGGVPGAPLTGGPAVQLRLEALRPRLAAACTALEKLTPSNGKQAAARAEMGARLVQLALAGGEPPRHLAALLRALQLPPDCTAHAHHKITTDLAEQASELCLDSRRSPPARC
ncbi:nuclear pore complex protein Nup98-Nup96 [Battus philenor]|uniref:nuclear pore complex protein Nup98-Nup96 n=1 Tax=Battus philenor TaxID=42288 RepID=UPI0035CF7A29